MSSFTGLLNNVVLLLAMGVIYDALGLHNIRHRQLREVLTGILLGFVGISVMLTPWELYPGVFFDARWILISLSGLYFGWTPTLIAIVMTVALRLYQGGTGMFVGSWVIICSGLIGLAWRYGTQKWRWVLGWGRLYLMGVSVQIAVLLSMLMMPAEMRFTIIEKLWLPLLLLFPPVTMLLGMLLQRQRDRRQAEDDLLHHQQLLDRERGLLKSLIDSIPDLIFYKSPTGVYLGCNSAFEAFTGKTEAELVGKSDYDMFEADVADFFREQDKAMLKQQAARRNEEWVTYPDSSQVLLDTLKTPFYSANGVLHGLIGISRDITEKSATQKALQNREQTYRSVLATALDGFWMVSADGIILEVNEAYLNMSGYMAEELINQPVYQFELEDSPEQVQDRIIQIRQTGGQHFRSRHRRKDGSAFPVEVNVSYWEGQGGRFFVFIKDISERVQAENKLLASERRFRHVFENMPAIAVQGYDETRTVIFWNSASEEVYGYSAEEALGKKLENLIIPDELRERVIDEVGRWVEGGPVTPPTEMLLQRKDGSRVPVFSTHVMVQGVSGRQEMYCIDMDLTDLKQAEERITTLSQALEQSPVSVILTDTHGVIEYVNGTFERVSGYRADEVLGQSTRMLKSGQTPPGKYQQLWEALMKGEAWEGEFQNITKAGAIYWEYAHIAPVTNSQGQVRHFLAVKQDITQQKAQEERILYQAHYDSLTGLPNRFLSLDHLAQMLKEARRTGTQTAVLFLDLDDFKKINDSLGHQAGDELLKEASRRLRAAIREGDLVGRLGGDEFILLLPDVQALGDVRVVAEKLLESFREVFNLNNRTLISTVSIGIAMSPDDGEEPAELLRKADAAMYHSKSQGRNTYNFYTASMNENVERRLLLEEQLRGALARNELWVEYQPLVDLAQRKVVGAEALLRWESPLLGRVSPEEFIPVSEQTGLIVPIGRFVLEQAVQFAVTQLAQDSDFHVAVNLSPRQFRDGGLVAFIHQLLENQQLPARALELEITEGVLMSGHGMIDDALAALSKMGIGISMDDFGTGYSSLSYLRSYPFDTLKVDKSFVNDITVDPADLELVSAAIAMGQGLGLRVIAEGVETAEQSQLLETLGCDFGQGYWFGGPVKADAFSRQLLN